MTKKGPPRLFRVLLPAKDLERSRRFYEHLLSIRGRRVAAGRFYFDCGPVLLGILDYSAPNAHPTPPTEALYLATGDLDGVYRRARQLRCLSKGLIHNDPSSPLGEIVVRPWGERSFYADDPSGNGLCFVDERTVFTGTARQVAALRTNLRAAPTRRPARRGRRSPGPPRNPRRR
jgi:catechol 2,3-dioxygenase-like lactoylglutathione lyase family enzyme